MGDVYKFAYCNLSATQASGGSYDGLYVDRDPLTVKLLLLSAKASQATPTLAKNQAYCIHRGLEEWTEVTNAALNKRAWVLQERIMSPRALHFCCGQVIFECCTAQCSERWPRRSTRLLDYNDYHHYPLKAAWAGLNAHSTHNAMDFWINIIEHYLMTDLSIGTDRLIARSVQSHLGNQEYVAGFWSDDLLSQPLWRCKVPAKVDDVDQNGGFVASSWSWISAHSRIDDLYPYTSKLCQKWCETPIELLDYETTPIHEPLGQTTDGFLKVRGKITKDLLGVPFDPKRSRNSQHDRRIRMKFTVVVAAYFDTNEEPPLEEVYCLPLFGIQYKLRLLEARAWLLNPMDYSGLLLLETGRGTGEFRRCGMFEIR
ncbi:hypothetical protein F5882DRAFT_503069 [Hyaloscypha sp. PMI_1271]|nr:hypothetical protein F5882DRAFT_503069 [Hyaloscypha sp. PMI_1271]